MSSIDDEVVVAWRAELDQLPTAREPRPWSVWRDPMTWVLAATGVWLLVLGILG